MKECPFCNTNSDVFFEHKIEKTHFREFYKCSNCNFIWVPEEFIINSDLEQKRYEKHQWTEVKYENYKNNTLSNYDSNLNKIIEKHITPYILNIIKTENVHTIKHFPINHLDYGSGKYPNLSKLMEWNLNDCNSNQIEKQIIIFKSYNYDKYYQNVEELISQNNYNHYKVITATEVIEHFTNPLENFTLLYNLLASGGILLITTELTTESIISNFSKWWYKNDITHICFYSIKTLEYLAFKLHLKLLFANTNLIIFQKL